MGYIKKTLLAAAVLAVAGMSLTAQSGQESSPAGTYSPVDESSIMIGVPAGTDDSSGYGGYSSVWLFVRMVAVLVLVAAGVFAFLRFIKKKGLSGTDNDDFLRRVASISLGAGRSVEIVTLVDRGYILGVTDGGISLISEISDPELVSALNLAADKKAGSSKPSSFADVLDMFMPHGPRTKNMFGDSEAKMDEIMSRNLDRLGKNQEDR